MVERTTLKANSFIAAVGRGDLDGVKSLIVEGWLIEKDFNDGIQWAAAYGRVDVLKFLLPLGDPMAENSWAVCWAAQSFVEQGNASGDLVECIRILLPVSDMEAAKRQIKKRNLDAYGLLCSLEQEDRLRRMHLSEYLSPPPRSAL